MELKASLKKPCTKQQRLNFIVEENHKKGYEIKETHDALEAWGATQEEIERAQKQAAIEQLTEQLNTIDLKTIRSLRAIQSGRGTQDDADRLAQYEATAEDIRQQIRSLQGV